MMHMQKRRHLEKAIDEGAYNEEHAEHACAAIEEREEVDQEKLPKTPQLQGNPTLADDMVMQKFTTAMPKKRRPTITVLPQKRHAGVDMVARPTRTWVHVKMWNGEHA